MLFAPSATQGFVMTSGVRPALGDFVQLLHEDHGKPRVHEDGELRSLRFSSGAVHSSMRLSAPFELDLGYTRTMMGFLLVNAEPRHILMVGLGGGSLAKYCYRQFPQARITTLEISPDVIALRDQFLIPPDDERFRVVQADGCEYLARSDIQADVILLDGYDAEGLPDRLCSEAFYANCWQALSAPGVLVANLWRDGPNREVYLDRLRGIFDGRVWWSRPRDSSNLIVFAVKCARYYPQWSRLMSQAQALGERYRLDLPSVVKDMRQRPDPDG
jgi:spermidine synthase